MAEQPKSKPKVFNGMELSQIYRAIEQTAQTQLGALKEQYTGDELTLLFVPYEYRKGLKLVYEIEDASRACGHIWIDLMSILSFSSTYDGSIFEDPAARASIKHAKLRLYFHRDFVPDGFVTPTPLFGTRVDPIKTLQPAPEPLRARFVENTELLLKIRSEWMMVNWMLSELQNSLRTPQQMRYVWPATYSLAKAADLKMDLAIPSSRAGFNAVPPHSVRSYLRETNDVVSRSALLGINEEYIARYNRNDVVVTDISLEVGATSTLSWSAANV